MKKFVFALLLIASINCIAQCTANFTLANTGAGTISYTSTSTGTNTGTYFSWDFGDGDFFSAMANPNATHTFYNGIYSTTLTINDTITPCTSTVAITFTVNNSPCTGAVSFNYVLQQNGVVNFYNATSGLNNFNWLWGFGNGNTSTLYNPPPQTYTASGVYNVTLTATDQLSICSYSSVQSISVTVATCSLNSAFTYTIGGGGLVNFTSVSTGTSGTTTYFWDFGDATNSGLQNPSHTYTSNGTYIITLSLQDSINFVCNSTSTQTINLNAPCFANVNFNMMKDSSFTSSIVWNAFPNYPSNIIAAQWFWGDASNTLALYPSHTYSAAGLYSICVNVTVSCGATATFCANTSIFKMANGEESSIAKVNVIDPTTVGIQNKIKDVIKLRLFPNPSKGEFELMLANASGEIQIIIYNMIGKEILRRTEVFSKGKSKYFNFSELESGVYFIQVYSGNSESHSKFIISK